MSKGDTYVSKTEQYLLSLEDEMEFELVDVEFVKEAGEYYLRVYCDMNKEGGITIDDCVNISHRLSDWLDETDFINETYTLEVSSPGLGRALKKDKDFEREIGQNIEIKLFKPIDKQKEFMGTLLSFDENSLTVQIGNIEQVFSRKDIANVRLSIDF